MCKAKELSFQLINILQTIKKDFKEINQGMSIADMTISDLQHEIEFGKFSASQGYLKLRQLQSELQKRRNIKDEWEIMKVLMSHINGMENNANKTCKNIINKEENFKNRKYHPRVLNNGNRKDGIIC